MQFTHVLCPTDLSEPSRRALTYATAVARWYGAKLTVLHVVPTFEPMLVRSPSLTGPVQMVSPVSREEVMDGLRRAAGEAGEPSLEPALAAEAGDPAGTIVDQALARRADLIVMGTHGRSGFDRFMIGSVAEEVLRKAPCPVMVVPPHAASARPGDVRLRTILCPTDFSPSALQAFGFARELARRSGAQVMLLYVIEWLAEEEAPAHQHFNVPEYRQYLIDDARQRLHGLATEAPLLPGAVQEMVVLGRAHREILRVADDAPVDLIVMGAQGRGGAGLALFGSTTHQVVRAASCPVLATRAIALPASE